MGAQFIISIGVALLLGLFIGGLTGFFGAGGGFILTPALNLFLGLPMPMAVGTGAAQICGTSLITLFKRLDRNFYGIRVALYSAIGIWPGTYVGALIVNKLEAYGERESNIALLSLFTILLLSIGVSMLFEKEKSEEESNAPALFAKLKLFPMAKFRTIKGGEFNVAILAIIGFIIGALSGLLGIGGGVVMLPILLYVVGQEVKYATLTSTILVFISSAFGSYFHLRSGHVDLIILVPLLVGAFFGSMFGVKLQKRCNSKHVKKSFVAVVFVAFLMVVYKLLVEIF